MLFNVFMKQTLTDDFWGLHKNMDFAFPFSAWCPLKGHIYLNRIVDCDVIPNMFL